MRVFLLFLINTLICAFSLSAQNKAPFRKVWDKTFGGEGADAFTTLLATPDGGYLLGGQSNGKQSGDKSENSNTFDFEYPYDYWIVKTDAQGNKQWDKTYGSRYNDFLTALQLTPDGGFLLGGRQLILRNDGNVYRSNLWIIKIDSLGNQLWDKTFTNMYTENLATILPTPDGGFLLGASGVTKSSRIEHCEPPEGNWTYDCENDYLITKIDAQGNELWNKNFGGYGEENLKSLIPTDDGGLLLGGWSGSGKSEDKSEDRKGVIDYWVVKIDDQGNKLWDKTLGGINSDRLSAMIPTIDGGYLLGGNSISNKSGDKSENRIGDTEYWLGNNDFWIIKTDANGNKLWDKTYGDDSENQLSAILPTADGGYLLGGTNDSTVEIPGTCDQKSGSHYWIIKIDRNGKKLWDYTFRGRRDYLGLSGTNHLKSMVNANDGAVLIGGHSSGNKGNDKSEDSKGGSDYWIIKITTIPTGITETAPNDLGLSVYPNPSDGTLTISHPGTEALTLELLDAKGSLLRTLPMSEPTTELTGLASGLYLLRFTTGSGKTHTQKIVVH